MSGIVKAHLALFTVNLIYGANYLIAKGLMPGKIGPSGFIFLRVTGALLLFGMLVLIFQKRMPVQEKDKRYLNWGPEPILKADIGRLIFCGLTGVAGNQLLFFNGLSLTSPINAAIIMTSNPILVLLLSALILRDRIPGLRAVGVFLGACGAVALILLSKGDVSGYSSPLGDTLVLLNSASYALYLVNVKPLMSKYRSQTVITWVFFFGTLFVLPIGFEQFTAVDWSSFNAWEIFSALYVVIGTTFFAYLLNISALRTVAPTVASSYIYLQPVMAGLFAALFAIYFTEDYTSDITAIKIACALLIFTGVYLVSKPSVKKV